MRVLGAVFVLALVTGCTTAETVNDDEQLESISQRVEDRRELPLNYETARSMPPPKAGDLRLDITLVDMDVRYAEALLGTIEESDIAPRVYSEAVGELAAAIVLEFEAGRVLARPSLYIEAGKTRFEIIRPREYLRDWSGGSPMFGRIEQGVSGELNVRPNADGSHTVEADLEGAHLIEPVGRFTVSEPRTGLAIETPQLVMHRRVGVETLKPDETAVFQISRARHHDTTRIRLLFVRVMTQEPDSQEG